jgi:SAM-dependent methyltransferase
MHETDQGRGDGRQSAAWIARTHQTLLALALLLLPWVAVPTPNLDVPYEPTPIHVANTMLMLAKVGPQDVVYDLGSGDGRIVIMAAQQFGARGVGIDIDPARIAEARTNARKAGVEDKVQFIEGDMFQVDLRPATVVTLFLHPGPNLKLRPKLLTELKPGSRIVSYVWDMGDWQPEAELDAGIYKVYLWRIPQSAARAGEEKR